jgi:hypothetical protein
MTDMRIDLLCPPTKPIHRMQEYISLGYYWLVSFVVLFHSFLSLSMMDNEMVIGMLYQVEIATVILFLGNIFSPIIFRWLGYIPYNLIIMFMTYYILFITCTIFRCVILFSLRALNRNAMRVRRYLMPFLLEIESLTRPSRFFLG